MKSNDELKLIRRMIIATKGQYNYRAYITRLIIYNIKGCEDCSYVDKSNFICKLNRILIMEVCK